MIVGAAIAFYLPLALLLIYLWLCDLPENHTLQNCLSLLRSKELLVYTALQIWYSLTANTLNSGFGLLIQ